MHTIRWNGERWEEQYELGKAPKKPRKVLERIDCDEVFGERPELAMGKLLIAYHQIQAKYPNKVIEIEYHKNDCTCGPDDWCYCTNNTLTLVVLDVNIIE